MKYKFSRRLVYESLRVIAFLFCLLPLDTAVFLAANLGSVAFLLAPGERKVMLENLRRAFGAQMPFEQLYKIAEDVFRNLGAAAAEVVKFPKINKSNIDRFVRAGGIENINKALSEKKGCIALTAHLGNWELLAAYLGLKGYPVNAVARPLRYHKYDEFINALRRSKNIGIIPREQSFKKIIAMLKDNQLVGIMPDQDIDSIDGVFVNFFGRPAYTPSGPALLAMASGSPIIPVFCVRQRGSRHILIAEEPIKIELTGNKERDVLVNTQKWSDAVENYIRRYPEQWVWMHKRWKTQPK